MENELRYVAQCEEDKSNKARTNGDLHEEWCSTMKWVVLLPVMLASLALLLLGVCMIYFGSISKNECPAEPMLPIYLLGKSDYKEMVK